MSEQRTCPQCGRSFSEPAVQCAVDGSALYSGKDARRVGTTVGNYELAKILGVGGMGVVYRARHVILDKPVAIKVLNDRFAAREGGAEQFLREAKAATRIRHPNIVDVFDFGTMPDGNAFFVMEFLEGISLEDVLCRDGHIPVFNAVNIVRQIAHALSAAHDEGIVHRDLKPENVFLISRPGRRQVVRRIGDGEQAAFVVEKEQAFDFVKLLDFGVAKFALDDMGPSTHTRAGLILGTPQYMSPEQARGEAVDGRSDIYALGALFYEMVTGVVPFDGETALDILNGHVFGAVIPPARRNPSMVTGHGTDETILRCLEKRKEDRYQSMYEVLDALNSCFTDQVFLRDANRLPGAMQAGIAVPRARPASGVAVNFGDDGRRPPTKPVAKPAVGAATEVPRRAPRGSKSITDDLSELFAAGDGGDKLELLLSDVPAVHVPRATDAAAPASAGDVVQLTAARAKERNSEGGRRRTPTQVGFGAVCDSPATLTGAATDGAGAGAAGKGGSARGARPTRGGPSAAAAEPSEDSEQTGPNAQRARKRTPTAPLGTRAPSDPRS